MFCDKPYTVRLLWRGRKASILFVKTNQKLRAAGYKLPDAAELPFSFDFCFGAKFIDESFCIESVDSIFERTASNPCIPLKHINQILHLFIHK